MKKITATVVSIYLGSTGDLGKAACAFLEAELDVFAGRIMPSKKSPHIARSGLWQHIGLTGSTEAG